MKRLLIVEDNEDNRDLLAQIFEHSYELELASDGVTAVEKALGDPPDLILMDIGLPRLSGLDAVRAIRAGAPEVPIVAVSARVMPADRERALEAGCDAFVPKPVDDILLAELVDRLVRR